MPTPIFESDDSDFFDKGAGGPGGGFFGGPGGGWGGTSSSGGLSAMFSRGPAYGGFSGGGVPLRRKRYFEGPLPAAAPAGEGATLSQLANSAAPAGGIDVMGLLSRPGGQPAVPRGQTGVLPAPGTSRDFYDWISKFYGLDPSIADWGGKRRKLIEEQRVRRLGETERRARKAASLSAGDDPALAGVLSSMASMNAEGDYSRGLMDDLLKESDFERSLWSQWLGTEQQGRWQHLLADQAAQLRPKEKRNPISIGYKGFGVSF